MADSELRQIASEIRTAYLELYSRHYRTKCGVDADLRKVAAYWDADHTTSNGRKLRRPIWYSLAETCLAQQLNPTTLVSALFELHRDSPVPPRPTSITSAQVLQHYKILSRDYVDRFRYSLRAQATILNGHVSYWEKQGIERGQAAVNVLAESVYQLEPLFRVCGLAAYGAWPWAGPWFPEASQEYRQHALTYDEAWAGWLATGPFLQQLKDGVFNG